MPKLTFSPAYKAFIEKLIDARKKAGFSMREISKRLNKDKTYCRRSEKLQRRIDFIELLEFAEIYNKPISYFVVDLNLNRNETEKD